MLFAYLGAMLAPGELDERCNRLIAYFKWCAYAQRQPPGWLIAAEEQACADLKRRREERDRQMAELDRWIEFKDELARMPQGKN